MSFLVDLYWSRWSGWPVQKIASTTSTNTDMATEIPRTAGNPRNFSSIDPLIPYLKGYNVPQHPLPSYTFNLTRFRYFWQPWIQILQPPEMYLVFKCNKCGPKPSKKTINHQCWCIPLDWSCFGKGVGRSWCRQKYYYTCTASSSSCRIVMGQRD